MGKEKTNSQLIDTTGFSDVTIGIIIYIENNYMNQLSLDMIAKHVGYNRNYICSVFKKDTGITIIDYLNFVRISQAASYFSYSDIDISQVCVRVGFSNVSHFNRTFKKLVGVSPGNYRRMFPLDVNGNLGKNGNTISVNEGEILTIDQALGTLYNPGAVRNGLKENI